jgi:hypothetical protein
MPWPRLLFEVLPLTVGTILISLSGARWLGKHLTSPMRTSAVLLGLLIFAAAVSSGWTAKWTIGLMGCFALLTGVLIGRWFPLDPVHWWAGSRLALLVAAAGAGTGFALGQRLKVAARVLWVSVWVYLAGWAILALRPGLTDWHLWAWAGMALFAGVLAVQVCSWRSAVPQRSSAAEAGALFLVLANLMLASLLLVGDGPM